MSNKLTREQRQTMIALIGLAALAELAELENQQQQPIKRRRKRSRMSPFDDAFDGERIDEGMDAVDSFIDNPFGLF